MGHAKTVTAAFDQKQAPPPKVITGMIQGWTGEEAVVGAGVWHTSTYMRGERIYKGASYTLRFEDFRRRLTR
jgi:hypothetical protein